MSPANRRLADRIETIVTKALGTRDPTELDQVIQELREALHEHAKRLREADAAHSKRSSAA
jgi:ABC-type transporter Mla subunit MlaD